MKYTIAVKETSTDKTMKYTIAIKETSTDKTIDTIGSSSSKRSLERTEKGVNINLNHSEYYTEIVEIVENNDDI